MNIEDTSTILSIVQTPSALVNPYDLRMVMIRARELGEVSNVLKSFTEELNTKSPSQGTTISHVTKDSVMLTCSYFKSDGWSIIVLNPVFQKATSGVKTGYQMNYFVEIKPKQINEVIKMLSKALMTEF